MGKLRRRECFHEAHLQQLSMREEAGRLNGGEVGQTYEPEHAVAGIYERQGEDRDGGASVERWPAHQVGDEAGRQQLHAGQDEGIVEAIRCKQRLPHPASVMTLGKHV